MDKPAPAPRKRKPTLLEQYEEYIERLKSFGNRMVTAPCPHCQTAIEAPAAPRGDKWDTAAQCPWCEEHYFRIVTHYSMKVTPL